MRPGSVRTHLEKPTGRQSGGNRRASPTLLCCGHRVTYATGDRAPCSRPKTETVGRQRRTAERMRAPLGSSTTPCGSTPLVSPTCCHSRHGPACSHWMRATADHQAGGSRLPQARSTSCCIHYSNPGTSQARDRCRQDPMPPLSLASSSGTRATPASTLGSETV